jgi:HPt (histidine-containing phosphotransfer) domain-containing protein
MPTDNPKISAYVPQPVYDAFKQFQEDRSLSMSQAAIAIFAEYLGVEEVKSGDSRVGGVTLERFEQLEQTVNQLKEEVERFEQLEQTVNQLKEEVENLKSTSSSPEVNQLEIEYRGTAEKVIDIDDAKSSSEKKNTTGELPIDRQNLESQDQLDNKKTIPSDQYELTDEQKSVPPLSPTSEPQQEIIKPISGQKLSSIRFGLGKDTVSGHKRKCKDNMDSFTEWTREKDPDDIGWTYTSKGYVPADELSSELHSKLQKWIEENIQ